MVSDAIDLDFGRNVGVFLISLVTVLYCLLLYDMMGVLMGDQLLYGLELDVAVLESLQFSNLETLEAIVAGSELKVFYKTM